MLKNGSFSDGWTDMPPTPDFLINQQPNGWKLRWIEKGESLFGAGDVARGIPECVHKRIDQLPANEQPGGSDALILAGDFVYKIFHAGASFGAELAQTVTGLEPGSSATLTAPVLADLHGDGDVFAAESGVWVNGEGHWVNGGEMGDREWFRHKVTFTVPDDGAADIAIRVKSKWMNAKDFFIDGITLAAAAADDAPPADPDPGDGDDTPVTPAGSSTVVLTAPAGLQVITGTAHHASTAVLIVPAGMKIEIKRR